MKLFFVVKSFYQSSKFGDRLHEYYYNFYRNRLAFFITYFDLRLQKKMGYNKTIIFYVIVLAVDVDQIVEQTMKEANPAKPGYITYDE